MYWPPGVPHDGAAELVGDDAHRLRQVLRLTVGDVVNLFDGRGHEWTGRVESVSRQAVHVGALETVTPVAEARVPVSLVVGVLKGDQMDAVVRDATMLGVAEIMPVQTTHVTVPERAWKSGAAVDRWQRVAIASATQCRRAVVPIVRPVAIFAEALRAPADLRLMCVEPRLAAADEAWQAAPSPSSVSVMVGPEGGWSADEVQQAREAGARLVNLGPRTLRAETAPLVALTLVAAAWGW